MHLAIFLDHVLLGVTVVPLVAKMLSWVCGQLASDLAEKNIWKQINVIYHM